MIIADTDKRRLSPRAIRLLLHAGVLGFYVLVGLLVSLLRSKT